MAAELVKIVTGHIPVSIDDIYYWSDSGIVLSWIQRDAATLVTFVANRVSDIQSMSDIRNWRYVETSDNPADLVSRGCSAQHLCKETRWFTGPDFLKGSQRDWPKNPQDKIILPEYDRTVKLVLTTTDAAQSLIETINHRNSFLKLQRIMAFIIRAVRRFKLKHKYAVRKQYTTTTVTAEEIDTATKHIFAIVQKTEYSLELQNLQKKKPLPTNSRILSLTPFLDEGGLIRVGGRLQQSSVNYDEKHPILLPPRHFVTRLYMMLLHVTNLHAGPQAMTAISRQRVWIVQGRQPARSIVSSCVRCARMRPKCSTQIMGQLPATRVTAMRPFTNCGVDFCGPFWTHFKIRGKKPQKSYIAVFCCFSTKAVHLEVVSDLTANAFIGALKRFMARRGSCQNIYCDNAKNFVGAHNQLKELEDTVFKNKDEILDHCSQKRIQFHFIPPRTPHMGGLWEAAVKSLKFLLYRTIASTALTYEELCTVASEVEAILNSRPLTAMTTDPNDFNALTPGHFLIGEPMTATVDPHALDQNKSLLSRWQLVSFCRNEFWKRWSVEYVTGLQKTARWVKEYPNMMTGSLVLIKEDNIPPLQWSMGRIVDVIYGPDNRVRVADVRTSTGILRRAIHNLAPLPIELKDMTTQLNTVVNYDNNDPTEKTVAKEKRKKVTSSKSGTKRARGASPLLTVLIVCLAMWPTSSMAQSRIKVQQLKTNAGVFYDHQGQLQPSPTQWSIMAYFNLDGYWAIDTITETLIQRMSDIAEQMPHSEPYYDISYQFSMQLHKLRQVNKVLLQRASSKNRERRGALNIIGTVYNRFFGILDDDYAQEMKAIIGNVENNEAQLNQLLNNHTSILDSTINIIKRDREEILNYTSHIEKAVQQQFLSLSNQVSEELRNLHTIQHFSLLSITAMSYLREYKQIQDNIADITFRLHQGHTSSHSISPDQLYAQLDLIRQQLPSSLILLQTEPSHLQSLYKLMTTQGLISGGYYLFKIKIPLVANIRFELYNLVPVPVIVNNSQVAIDITTKHLAIDLHNNQFYWVSEFELENCALITTTTHICDQIRPIENGYSRAHQCESELMFAKTLPASCSITFKLPRDSWSQLSTTGSWLFVAVTPCDVSIICQDGDLERVTIKDAGILSLDKGCTLKTKNITLTSYQDRVTTLQLANQPQFNLTSVKFPIHAVHLVTTPTNTTLGSLLHQNLALLENQVNMIHKQQLQLTKLQPHDVHQYTVGYITLCLIIVISVYIGLQAYIRKRKAANIFVLKTAQPGGREDV